MFRSKTPKAQAAEVHAAYRDRIKTMATYGEDSPEGLVAEVKADDMADAFRAQTGRDWQDVV
ncbi:hypothetical protein [Streptomyces prasinopilosus]|uniref:hypothetical protein n=1 Tax=Streptomyces prasinopilosus TaxID=67344 RepID=UPI0006EBB886|nr:hypothetical protein [Streptomyces prasinopilosus]